MTRSLRGNAGQAGPADHRNLLRWRVAGWGTAALLMLVPTAAALLSDEMGWSAGDFVLFGALLLTAGGALEWLLRRSGSRTYRFGAAVVVAGALLLLWVNGAVGVIGSEDNPANVMVPSVLLVGLAGALLARFEPAGMARGLLAMAGAQLAVALIAAVAGWGSAFAGTAIFCALWLVSAELFRRSAAVAGR